MTIGAIIRAVDLTFSVMVDFGSPQTRPASLAISGMCFGDVVCQACGNAKTGCTACHATKPNIGWS